MANAKFLQGVYAKHNSATIGCRIREFKSPTVSGRNEKIDLALSVREIGWSHNCVKIEKCKDLLQRKLYDNLPEDMRKLLPSPDEIATIIAEIDGGDNDTI